MILMVSRFRCALGNFCYHLIYYDVFLFPTSDLVLQKVAVVLSSDLICLYSTADEKKME